MKFAGCFIDQPKVYAKQQTRLAGKFSEQYERTIPPNKARPAYRGKVVLLTGPGNMSSAEDFVLMMRQASNCTTMGGKTYGASGNPKSADLGNGVVVYLSSWREFTPDGKGIEGVGIAPDVAVDATPAGLKENDAILEAALKKLR
jgi:carboxyl-terminal processing protease